LVWLGLLLHAVRRRRLQIVRSRLWTGVRRQLRAGLLRYGLRQLLRHLEEAAHLDRLRERMRAGSVRVVRVPRGLWNS
jgi:hypothetical protein